MASIFKQPLQAVVGQANKPNAGPLENTEAAKNNTAVISDGDVQGTDPSWVFVGEEIDGLRWSRSYPYQLLIVEAVSGSSEPGYVITENSFTLPIPPSELSLDTPFAIPVAATLGGIVEEHNGAPFRMINFSGTTGVTPLRGSAAGAGQSNLAAGIFAGTVIAGQNLASAAQSLVGSSVVRHNLVEETDEWLKGTGYYQFRLLQNFLEGYATLKKKGRSNLRLAFATWKDQAIYLVTPQAFSVRRSASAPLEYSYALSLKAWKRITLNGINPGHTADFHPVGRDPTAFAQLLNKLQEARRVLQGSADVLRAVRGDIQALLFEPLREVTLFAKDTLGVAITAADLPASLWGDMKSAVLQAQQGFTGLRYGIYELERKAQDIQDLAVESGKTETQDGASSSSDALTGAAPANKTFEEPENNFDLMERVKPSELDLPPSVQRKINDEKDRIRGLKRHDFEVFRDSIQEFEAQFADAVGAGNSTFDETFGRASVTTTREPTAEDFEVLFALNQTILEMNRLAASGDIGQATLSTVDAVAGMASAAGIAFTTPVGKLAVPFPYGSTLEQLSATYLGTPDRWHEIATLNGLRQPYVDEEGFDLPLVVNGTGNEVVVADASNLTVGQLVTLSSTNTTRTTRRITKIDPVSQGMTILYLNGEPDLERFTTLALSFVHAYLPDTVNSQQLIYVPSDIEPDANEWFTKSIPGVDQFDRILQSGGVDLLLTSTGDLAVTPDGDCRLAVGLTNIIQRIRIAIGTPRGSLLHYPDFGLGAVPGVSTADLDPRQMLTALQDMFRSDPSFGAVSGVSISKNGPVLRISMSVGVAGTNQVIPLTVDVRS